MNLPDDLQKSIETMSDKIAQILYANQPSIYLYGSCALDDFKLGWSDIDLLVLTQTQITVDQAESLVDLRQTMLSCEPDNPFYRSFEGGMLTLSAFLLPVPDRVVYWGTHGQRITDFYVSDSFCMAELYENGILLKGQELHHSFYMPDYPTICLDIQRHLSTIRQFAQETRRNFYSFGWFLDISRGIYTLRTGKIIAKTAAGEWALENGLCPDPEILETVLLVRKNPMEYRNNKAILDFAATLGSAVQRYADVLEHELTVYSPSFIEENCFCEGEDL